MNCENEFGSVLVSWLMNYTGADFTPGLLHKSCIWNEETSHQQGEKEAVWLRGITSPVGIGVCCRHLCRGCLSWRTVTLPAE